MTRFVTTALALVRESAGGNGGASFRRFLVVQSLANLAVLAGALFFGWTFGGILILYWAESGIIGFYTVVRILAAGIAGSRNDRGTGFPGSLFLSLFFIVHFGIFMSVHLVFLGVLFDVNIEPLYRAFSGGWSDFRDNSGAAYIGLLASHGYSLVTGYFGTGKFRSAVPAYEMFKPYPRVVLLHLTIMAGGFALAGNGDGVATLSTGALAAWVTGKTILDIVVSGTSRLVKMRIRNSRQGPQRS